MYEVELKVRADHEPVRRRLADRGVASLGRVVQIDTYYDAPDREFGETDEALRLRRERADETTAVLTYKGPLVETASKSREEHEVTVSDADETEALLEGLGYRPAATVRKERERFRVGEYTLALDDVDGLGEFVEAETEAGDDEFETAREGAVELLESLGLAPGEQIQTSYLGLLLEQSDAPATDPDR